MNVTAAQLAHSIPMVNSAGAARRVTIRVRKETGKLFLDFFYRGVRCREQTDLEDTEANRLRLTLLGQLIEEEIRGRRFNFAAVFPHSPRASLFANNPGHGKLTRARVVKAPVGPLRENVPWTQAQLLELAETRGNAVAMRHLAARQGRTLRSVQERHRRLLRENEGAAPRRTNARGPVRPWTQAELEWLVKNYATATVEDLAKHLPGRTLAAVRVRASEMGLALPRSDAARLSKTRP